MNASECDSRGHWGHKMLDLQAPSGDFGNKRQVNLGMSDQVILLSIDKQLGHVGPSIPASKNALSLGCKVWILDCA